MQFLMQRSDTQPSGYSPYTIIALVCFNLFAIFFDILFFLFGLFYVPIDSFNSIGRLAAFVSPVISVALLRTGRSRLLAVALLTLSLCWLLIAIFLFQPYGGQWFE